MLPFYLLYSILVLTLFVGGFFILYHILRYSLNDSLGYFGAAVFGSFFLLLIFLNVLSFQAMKPAALAPDFELGPILPNSLTLPATSTRNPW